MMAIRRQRGPRSYRPIWFYFSNFPQYELGYYGEAFLDAARTLMRSLRRRRGFSSVAAAPVLFTYRHAIELLLKSVIVGAERSLSATADEDVRLFNSLSNHRLTPLWSRAKAVLDEAGWRWFWPHDPNVETFEDVERLLQYIEGIDPTSFSFRYPVTKRGTRSIPRGVEIPFEVVVGSLDSLAEALSTVNAGLSAERSR